MTTTTVLDELRSMLVRVLDQYGLDDLEITRETSFHDDLGLESIDLVTLGSLLVERYGEHVNLAAYLAELDLDGVIALTVGDLADFVIARVG
ncbi:phosphopantetheine-binding protein [Saccharothrix sp. NPDC042600]|uniref:Phosphopantetheine-binding protein n=1 Tax=Saccharothrix mutabilis subsp. mutabilis TaxID=66855 RepID=A0ABP3DNI1_9PSEU|nr:phosphopantetheine-binding protein [Saccharothrix mutabilis subsp. capreolus]